VVLIRNILHKDSLLLHPDGSGQYQDLEVIGTGASCIVYRAEFVDHSGFTTKHLLKEYNPAFLHTERRADGVLVPDICDRKAYEAGLCRFRRGYTLQEKIRHMEGLTNSTSNIQRVFDANGTAYIDMTVMEGQTYTQAEDSSLHQLLRRMKTLTKVVDNYHKAGFLHLDIKPDNIFVYPETPEMLLLFDFDSVIEKDRVSTAAGLSYTKSWAAPEQLTPSKQKKICEATDFYPIGEIIFTRIFGRHSETADRRSFSSYNYDLNAPLLKNVNPRVFPLLTKLFHKTICGMPEKRYQHADALLAQLDKLISLTDPHLEFVNGNFTYQSAGFYGREDLLQEIQEFFSGQSSDKGNALFLNGIGGIGKTELAKRYAYLHQQEYVRIIFLPFQNSIEETVCQDALQFYHGAAAEQGEADGEKVISSEELYASRLRLLKEDLTPQDLLILDNFDVFDEKIQDLLDIDCKLLITTRLDFSDYDFPQKTVSAIHEISTLWDVFHQYNKLDYEADECAQIEALMDYVDYHTMTICLIAKYLRTNGDAPSALLKKLKTQEGITATQESTHVGHRKDRRLTNESVQKHLRILFDLSRFSQNEIDFLAALSLFGPVRIAKDTLRELFGALYQEDTLQSLTKTGWVELSEDNIISLHQIILDLAYNSLTSKCSSFMPVVQGMVQYAQDRDVSRNSRQSKSTLAKLFLERIHAHLGKIGKQALSVAELYFYFYRLSWNRDALMEAENICGRFSSQKSRELQFKIACERIDEDACRYQEAFENAGFSDPDEETIRIIKKSIFEHEMSAWKAIFYSADKNPDAAAHIKQLLIPDASVCGETDAANLSAFLRRVPVLPELNCIPSDTFDKLLKLADTIESTASSICGLETELTESRPAYSLYLEEELLLRYAYLLAATVKQDHTVLENLLEQLSTFYSEDDFSQVARWSCFADSQKMAFYTFQLRQYRPVVSYDGPHITFCSDGLSFESYLDSAADEARHRNYQKAIELLLLALEQQDDPEELILSRISWNYLNLYISRGMLQDAYDCLHDQLAYDRQYGFSDFSTLITLAEVCRRLGKKEESIVCYNTLLDKYRASYDDLDDGEKVDLLLSYFLRAELDEQYQIDVSLGQWIAKCMIEFDDCGWLNPRAVEIYPRIFEHLKHLVGFPDAIKLVIHAANELETGHQIEAEVLYLFVCEVCDQNREYDLCFETALRAVRMFSSSPLPNRSKLLKLLEDLSQKPGLISQVNLERYHDLQADLYFDQPDHDPDALVLLEKKCNYYLIAEHDAEACDPGDQKQKADAWENARFKYSCIPDYANARRCCIQIDALLSHPEDSMQWYSLRNNCEEWLRIERSLNDSAGMYQCLEKLYRIWCHLAVQDDSSEYDIASSMQSAIREFAYLQDPIPAIYIGLLQIHRLLSEKSFSLPAELLLSDQNAVRSQILRLVNALPDAVSDNIRDDIQYTLQIIVPLYHSAFPENTAVLERFQKACNFCGIEEKHSK